MAGRTRGEPEYKAHPLLDEQRPELGRHALTRLRKSIKHFGQLQEILVTQDDYIVDGRARYQILKALRRPVRVHHLPMWSGIEEIPGGSSAEEEIEACLEVIEETARNKWRKSARKGSPSADIELVPSISDIEPAPLISDIKTRSLELLCGLPCDGTPVYLQIPQRLRGHLEHMALLHTSKKKGPVTTASVPAYIRRLCWDDFLAQELGLGAGDQAATPIQSD